MKVVVEETVVIKVLDFGSKEARTYVNQSLLFTVTIQHVSVWSHSEG